MAGAALPGLSALAHQRGGKPGGVEVEEPIGAVQVTLALGKGLHLLVGMVAADFGHAEPATPAVGQGPDPCQEVDDPRVGLVVELVLEIERSGALATGRRRRIVPQLRVVHGEIDGVKAETVNATVQPEAGDLKQGVLDCRIVQVELRLLRQEVVHVILAASGVPGPGRTGEDGLPVVGRRSIGTRVRPDIPVRSVPVAGLATVVEPRVLVRCVRKNQIGDDLEAEGVGARDQAIEIGQGPEHGIDVAIVCHVVAEVLHGRGEEWAKPDGVDAERGDIVEVPGNAGQIPDAVAVRIGEAARIDLIDNRPAPPVGSAGKGRLTFEYMGGHAGLSETQTR